MKTLILTSIALAAALALSGCGPADAKTHEQPPENGAQFKKDFGLTLTDTMKKAIALKIAEVSEEKIAPAFTVALSATGSAEVGGWLTAEQAGLVKPGMEVELHADTGAQTGKVVRVEKAPYATVGDFEITVAPATPLDAGTRVTAAFRGAAGDAVTAVPGGGCVRVCRKRRVLRENAGQDRRTERRTCGNHRWPLHGRPNRRLARDVAVARGTSGSARRQSLHLRPLTPCFTAFSTS